MSAKDEYRKAQQELFALLPQGILESKEGQDWYNRQADEIAQAYLKNVGRKQAEEEQSEKKAR